MHLSSSFRVTLSALLISSTCLTFTPALAQDDDLPPPVAPAPSAGLQATDLQMRMGALENLVRAMTGQVEKLQFLNNQLLQAQQKIAGDNEVRFKDIEQKLATHEANMKGLVAAQQNLAQAQSQAQAVQQTPPPVAQQPATPPAAAEQPAKALDAPPVKEKITDKASGTLGTITTGKGDDATAQTQYDEAFNALRQAKYDEAEKTFTVFLKNHPKHHLTENARYWLAETFYVRGKFQEAAVAFAEAYQEFPKGAKAPDNLLKLSMSLGSLGKKADACVTLGELSKKFPSASGVTKNRAEQQKKTLGCS
ncbi:MAG: tol-pal system protein YbgF [Alphaproteobacteria bacterium]|nr:tol-pal system protein YbgF [Alphaproteobacteria bacterium]